MSRRLMHQLQKMHVCLTLLCCIFANSVLCNVEKIIFTAPEATILPRDGSIDNLLLISLNPDHPSVRTRLNATFPSEEKLKGTESWLLLEGLNPGQRYEVRICWLATQPTAFWLYTHSLTKTFETPPLISSLSSYAYTQHAGLNEHQMRSLGLRKKHYADDPVKSSILFLQIHAAADYFSLNEALMTNVPPVLVDIILDPYLLNMFPQSLVPTAIYITIVAIGAGCLSIWVVKQIQHIQISPGQPSETNSPSSDSRDKKQQ